MVHVKFQPVEMWSNISLFWWQIFLLWEAFFFLFRSFPCKHSLSC